MDGRQIAEAIATLAGNEAEWRRRREFAYRHIRRAEDSLEALGEETEPMTPAYWALRTALEEMGRATNLLWGFIPPPRK